MKYLKIILDPIKLKGRADDPETIQADLYEHIQVLLEAEALGWSIDEDSEDESED
jgi:hypothetical protein